MNPLDLKNIMEMLNGANPGPFFVLSIIPYLLFLYWAQQCRTIPKISLWGFRLTLLFVLMTIIFAIVAKISYNAELTEVDTLHGFAEAFLALSDALIVIGFIPSKNLGKVMKNS